MTDQFLPHTNEVGKVMFSQASVSHSMYRGGGWVSLVICSFLGVVIFWYQVPSGAGYVQGVGMSRRLGMGCGRHAGGIHHTGMLSCKLKRTLYDLMTIPADNRADITLDQVIHRC